MAGLLTVFLQVDTPTVLNGLTLSGQHFEDQTADVGCKLQGETRIGAQEHSCKTFLNKLVAVRVIFVHDSESEGPNLLANIPESKKDG